jgi:lysozyme
MMSLSPEGVAFIRCQEEEGGRYRAQAYDDGTGTPTACWGCTHGVKMGQTYTLEQCEQLWGLEIDQTCATLNKLLGRPVSQGLYDALVSFGFNNGFGKCGKLLNAVNHGTDAQIRAAFMLYIHARDERSGRVVEWPGLVKRRSAELAYWAEHDAKQAPQPPAIERTKPAIKTAASSPSLWALLNAKVVLVLGVATDAIKHAWEWGASAIGVVPDVENDVQGLLSHGQTFSTWLHLDWERICLAVVIPCILVAFVRHLRDKRAAP